MLKRFCILLLLAALTASVAACTTNEAAIPPQPSAEPSPTAVPSPEPSSAATLEPSSSPTISSTDASAFKQIAAGAKLQYNGNDVDAIPYYGADDVILLPLQPLAEAMGWKVEKSVADTNEALLLTKAGKDDLMIEFILASVGQNQVSGVTARKGVTSVKIDPMLYVADGAIYVPASFIDDAMEKISVSYDGKSTVSVKSGA